MDIRSAVLVGSVLVGFASGGALGRCSAPRAAQAEPTPVAVPALASSEQTCLGRSFHLLFRTIDWEAGVVCYHCDDYLQCFMISDTQLE